MGKNTEAIKALEILEITYRNQSVTLDNGFEPAIYTGDIAINQSALEPKTYGSFETSETDTETGKETARHGYMFIVTCGARFLSNKVIGKKGELVPEKFSENVLAELQCTFAAHYSSNAEPGKLSEACLERFLVENVPYHVTPYWRHWLQLTCTRYNLPKIKVPFYQTISVKKEKKKKGKKTT